MPLIKKGIPYLNGTVKASGMSVEARAENFYTRLRDAKRLWVCIRYE